MPTAGTHITIVELLAASSPQFKSLLGDPGAGESTPAGRQMRFAKLGAVGPDIFYCLADYGGGLQDLENLLAKTAGTYECMSELMEKIDRAINGVESALTFGLIDELRQSFELIRGIVTNGILGLIVDAGFNAWPFLEPAREKDQRRTTWFWADYLHYIRTGHFALALLRNSKASGNPNLYAYALGYLTHFVTDVVGHPYVNQVVQAPWRLYWQRHHLVENFIDAYLWDRHHTPLPAVSPIEEPPLDSVTETPNEIGSGAPFTFARLHDHISIGVPTLGDPIDALIQKICQDINGLLFQIGLAENTDLEPPNNPDFVAWTELLAFSLRDPDAYGADPIGVPSNLQRLQVTPRPDGFPTAEDIAGAYSTTRLLLKFATEETIQPPRMPDIIGDITEVVLKLATDLGNDLSEITKDLSRVDFDPEFSWDGFKNAVRFLADLGEDVFTTVADVLVNSINLNGQIFTASTKFALYLLNTYLFSLYRQVRFTMVLAAYYPPFTGELEHRIAKDLNTTEMWQSDGNLPPTEYPRELIAAERTYFPVVEIGFDHLRLRRDYAPFIPPDRLTAKVEQPPVNFTAPYAGVSENPAMPQDFVGTTHDRIGPDNMFDVQSGPQTEIPSSDPNTQRTFTDTRKDFGTALANCKKVIELAEAGLLTEVTLPDYQLDGDRGYAWPCWDTNRQGTPDSLDPTNTQANPDGAAHVNAVAVDF